MNPKQLNPNPKNPRKITDKKLKALKAGLDEFGDLGGIVFNRRSGQLIGGHQRVKALDLDAAKIEPILDYDPPTRTGTVMEGYVHLNGERFSYREVDWDDAREKSANIAANKGAGEWDMAQLTEWFRDLDGLKWNLDLTMFDEDERKQFFKEEKIEGLTDPDDIPEKVSTRCQPGDLWLLGNHRLLCGDSTNILDTEKLMNNERAVLCFTSPPYSDQREYNGSKELSTEYLATFIRSSFSFVDIFAVNLGISRKNNEINQYWNDYIKEARDCGLKLLSWNIWDKGEAGSIGNQTAMFAISHEWIFIFGNAKKELNRTVRNISAGHLANYNGNRQKDGSIKKQKNKIVGEFSQLKTILHCIAQKARDEIDHPARFPVELPETYILACSDPNQIIYEPFCGSGTTLIACEKTKRECYGMEIDPHYCDIIIERWEKFTGQKALLAQSREENANG